MSEFDKPSQDELIAMTTYTIFRTGNAQQRYYQVNKMRLGVRLDEYWVQLRGNNVFCNCPGFRRQNFPKIDHKHVKIAQDFSDRGEPVDAEYKIVGTGAEAQIEVIK